MDPSFGMRRSSRHPEPGPAGTRQRRAGHGPSATYAKRLRLLLWTLRLLVSGALAAGVGYLPYHLYLRSGLSHFVSLRAELSALEARNQKLRASIVELRLQLAKLKEDSEAIERVARDELGMVRSGEVVFKVE